MGICANCKHKEIPGYYYPCCRCDARSEYETAEIRTNGDRIRAMSDAELAEFLNSLAFRRETPWDKPFEERCCKKCPTVTVTAVETGEELELNECDFVDGKCPHGDDILWWLQQVAVDNKPG
ncbi:MAG: hypothetical protein J6K89_01540 [Oscillospiraceae bacterium]|nr:hypothetical protein [Oscillospiraceae bacterium]